MLLVFGLAIALWGLGYVMRTPHQARWISIGLLLTAVLAIHVILPEGHPLRVATGGSAALWLLLLAFAAMVYLYREVLMKLRAKAETTEQVTAPKVDGPFGQVELERVARHIVLREIGGPGQRQIKDAKILVIGAGGLGSSALMTLAASGVGVIGIVDDDLVENSNLQRQTIHQDQDIGMPKVFSAQAAMAAQNPFVEIRPYNRRLTDEIAEDLFADYDLVLDGTDDTETRYLVNRTAVALGRPLVSGALSQWEGQISVFDPAGGAPCYACVFPVASEPGLAPSCAEAGVFAPLPGIVGAMMAGEALKIVTGAGTSLKGRMLIYDALYGETREVRLKRRADCPVCGGI